MFEWGLPAGPDISDGLSIGALGGSRTRLPLSRLEPLTLIGGRSGTGPTGPLSFKARGRLLITGPTHHQPLTPGGPHTQVST